MSLAMDLAKAARDRHIRMFIVPKLHGFSMSCTGTGRLMDASLIGKPLFKPGCIPVVVIIKTVADAHQITKEELCGPGRCLQMVKARMHAVALIRAIWPSMSLKEIGRRLGNKNHSSIINAVARWPHYRAILTPEIAIVMERLRLDHDY